MLVSRPYVLVTRYHLARNALKRDTIDDACLFSCGGRLFAILGITRDDASDLSVLPLHGSGPVSVNYASKQLSNGRPDCWIRNYN